MAHHRLSLCLALCLASALTLANASPSSSTNSAWNQKSHIRSLRQFQQPPSAKAKSKDASPATRLRRATSRTRTGSAAMEPVQFDPAHDDPNWPGRIPPNETSNRLYINVQYDGYPNEVVWKFERLVEDGSDADIATLDQGSPPLQVFKSAQVQEPEEDGGAWIVEDSFVGDQYLGAPGRLLSFDQSNLQPDTRYRFSILDTAGDGICCEWGAMGWVAITTTTSTDTDRDTDSTEQSAALWSIRGDAITNQPLTVELCVDADGVVSLADSHNETDAPLRSTTLAPSTVAQATNQGDAPTSVDIFGVAYDIATTNRIAVLSSFANLQGTTIPTEIGLLTELNYLSLWRNQLVGPIPSELAQLTALTSLSLAENQLSGPIPSEIGSMTQLGGNLGGLSLFQNELTGELPSELGLLTALTVMDFGGNRLSGVVPSNLCSNPKLWRIQVDCAPSPFPYPANCTCDECQCA